MVCRFNLIYLQEHKICVARQSRLATPELGLLQQLQPGGLGVFSPETQLRSAS